MKDRMFNYKAARIQKAADTNIKGNIKTKTKKKLKKQKSDIKEI